MTQNSQTRRYLVTKISGRSNAGGEPDSIANKTMGGWNLSPTAGNHSSLFKGAQLTRDSGSSLLLHVWEEEGENRASLFTAGQSRRNLDRGKVLFQQPIGGSPDAWEIVIEGYYLIRISAECRLANDSDQPIQIVRSSSETQVPAEPSSARIVVPAIVKPIVATIVPTAEDPHETPPFEGAIKALLDEVVPFRPAQGFSGQPRKKFNPIKLQELADSIQENGQHMAILARPIDTIPGKKYEIIGGERRWKACRIAGKRFVWLVVKKTKDKKSQHLTSMIENMHREPNSELEKAIAIQEQLDAGETVVALTKALGKGSRQAIYNVLSLLKLHPDIQALLDKSVPKAQRINTNIGSLLAKAPQDRQVGIWKEASKELTRGLVIRKLHQLVKEFQVDHARNRSWNNPSEIARGVKRKIDKLAGVLLELSTYRPEELIIFASFEGAPSVNSCVARIAQAATDTTELQRKILEAQEKISSQPKSLE